jgi:iron complex transport system ATP-binding protein
MSAVIETQSLCVRIDQKKLIDQISLSVAAGETVALVGPNGAGKSTLIRALAGEIAPSSGTVRLKGHDARAWRPHELALRRAVLSQNVSVAFPFSVGEIVRMGAGDRPNGAIASLTERALAEVDLEGFHDRIIGTLSGGEQQRVHFARILVQLACGEAIHGPGILLLDEPTASLDLRHQLDVIAAARKRAQSGTTVISILHDLNLAALFASRIVVLGEGRVAADGAPAETITDTILSQVFGVSSAVSRIPDSTPFVLPHSARRRLRAIQ